jgi:hypothetical protein
MVPEDARMALKVATVAVALGSVVFVIEVIYHSFAGAPQEARTQSGSNRLNQLPDFAQAILRDNPELVAQLRAQIAGQNGTFTGGSPDSASKPGAPPAQQQNSDDGTYELDWSEGSHSHNKVRIVLRKAAP